jgi:hypothetical protein
MHIGDADCAADHVSGIRTIAFGRRMSVSSAISISLTSTPSYQSALSVLEYPSESREF